MTKLEPNLGQTWAKPGPNLGQIWAKPGPNLGQTWALVQTWAKPGPNLGQILAKSGPNQVQTWAKPGPNPSQVFNTKCGRVCVFLAIRLITKKPNLELKTWPKQLFGYLPLPFALHAQTL
jgi:hypothetical protein